MEVREVDPRDDAAVAAWFAVIDAWQRAGRPDEPGWLLHEQAAILRLGAQPDADERRVGLIALEDGQVLAAARLDLPVADNTHLADVLLVAHPDYRRRGAGRALVQEVERRARAADRTTLTASSDELPGEQGRSASRGFGPALGFVAMQVEVRRDIALPLDSVVVAALAAVAAEHAAAYDLRTWRDAVPEDLVEDQAHLFRRMSTDVPLADLDWREEQWDAARVRRDEQDVQAMGRTFFGAGAVHRPSGRMVSYTTMGFGLAAPERAYQWDTLVLTEHRGHSLGTLVKLACLQRLAGEVSEVCFISTWNAAENAPMIRVNDLLGAKVNGQLVNWQKRLD